MLAVVWTYWIGFFLAIGTVAMLLAVIGGYIAKVSMPNHLAKAKTPNYPKKP